MNQKNSKTVFCTLTGRPNVGKSSILNALVGEKIAIVTDKPQTTRTRIQGILTRDGVQFVFLDTPGFHLAKNKLSDFMVETVRQSVVDTDLTVFVADASRGGSPDAGELALLGELKAKGRRCILAMNKVDLLEKKEDLLPILDAYSKAYDFESIVPVSAKEGTQLSVLLDEIASFAQEGPHYFPDDTLTDQPERVIMGELLREQALRLLEREVPHGIGILVERMSDREDSDIVDIDAVIYCEKESHKGIVIGKGGSMLKKISSAAREEMEKFLGCRVNLQCWVKVKEGWRNRDSIIRMLGFVKE